MVKQRLSLFIALVPAPRPVQRPTSGSRTRRKIRSGTWTQPSWSTNYLTFKLVKVGFQRIAIAAKSVLIMGHQSRGGYMVAVTVWDSTTRVYFVYIVYMVCGFWNIHLMGYVHTSDGLCVVFFFRFISS